MVTAELSSHEAIVRQINHFEDFMPGKVFRHHWGKTITRDEAIAFSTQMTIHEPYSFNLDYAQRLGHPDVVVPALLVFSTVLGLSVEDLSESGGPFLGAEDIRFLGPVHAGATLYAATKVISCRDSGSRPRFGIVEWETHGVLANGREVIRFRRTNLVRRREGDPND